MTTKLNPIPDGYHTVTPVLTVQEAAKLIDFLKQAFDAKEMYRLDGPDGTVMHPELKIGDSMVMVGEATDQWTPTPATVALYVEDTDGGYQRALRAGASSVREPSDQFYGDRSAGVKDFTGNHWWIHTYVHLHAAARAAEQQFMRDFTTVRKAVEAAYGLRCAIDEGLGHSSRQEGGYGLDARADGQGRDEAMI